MSTRYLEGRMWLLHKGSAFLCSTPISYAFPSFISFAINESQTSNCNQDQYWLVLLLIRTGQMMMRNDKDLYNYDLQSNFSMELLC